MNSYSNYATVGSTYRYLWEKYRPAILKLMVASAEAPQQYKFSSHEVKTASPKDKGGLAFTLKVHKSKALNDIRKSVIAKDLLQVLQQSAKASELSDSCIYEFTFDKHFVLHVIKTDIQPEIVDKPESIITEQSEG